MRINLNFLSLFLSLFYINWAYSQHAQFETAFYFQDAVGNRDTVIIGADTSAYHQVNTHLGETLITEPWDSTFEVRVAKEDNYQNALWFGDTLYLYNKRITYLLDVPECGYSTSVIFLMYTKHYPVTVTWDTSVWSFSNSPCPLDGSFFLHTNDILEPGWWPSYTYACLGSISSFSFDTIDPDPYTGIIDSVTGVGNEFIYGLQLRRAELESPISPCYLEVATKEPLIPRKTSIYPNPSSGIINIDFKAESFLKKAMLSIRNLQGIEILRIEDLDQHKNPISLLNLPNGIYLVSIVEANSNAITTQRIVITN
ncbi:MAG: T9SS type A sorting domain-containing protein [Saprospiraceae bacterium]